MGKLILCSGSRTNKPFVLTGTNIRVYSMEELCYYIYQHIFFIDIDLFSEPLFDWIEEELKLKDRAEKLRMLKQSKADLKNCVTVLLCSCDYYKEAEIKGLLKTIDYISNLTPIKRCCVRANYYLKNNQFIEAAQEYERILNSKETALLSPKDYGDILHNVAIVKLHTTGLIEAMNTFQEAYSRNNNKETLRQYLYSVRLLGNDELYKKELEKYQHEEEVCSTLDQEMKKFENEAEHCEQMIKIKQLNSYKSQGKRGEYNEMINNLLDQWIQQYRR